MSVSAAASFPPPTTVSSRTRPGRARQPRCSAGSTARGQVPPIGEPAEYFDGGTPDLAGRHASRGVHPGPAHGRLRHLADRPRLGNPKPIHGRGGDKRSTGWSPDGERLHSLRRGGNHPRRRRRDPGRGRAAASGSRRRAPVPGANGVFAGRPISPLRKVREQRNDLLALPLDGERTPRPVAVTPARNAGPGVAQRPIRRLSVRRARPIRNFRHDVSRAGGRWQVSQTGGREARWSKAGSSSSRPTTVSWPRKSGASPELRGRGDPPALSVARHGAELSVRRGEGRQAVPREQRASRSLRPSRWSPTGRRG